MAYHFPDMDPYLEDSTIWRDFHHSLAEEIRGRSNAKMNTKYYAGVEVYTTFDEVLIGEPKPIVPDVSVLQPTPRDFAGSVLTAAPPQTTAPIRRLATMMPVRARYALRIDYRQPVPPPALRSALAAWAQTQVATRRFALPVS